MNDLVQKSIEFLVYSNPESVSNAAFLAGFVCPLSLRRIFCYPVATTMHCIFSGMIAMLLACALSYFAPVAWIPVISWALVIASVIRLPVSVIKDLWSVVPEADQGIGYFSGEDEDEDDESYEPEAEAEEEEEEEEGDEEGEGSVGEVD